MSYQIYNDRSGYSPSLAAFSDLSFAPLVYAAATGAIAAGTLVADWLSKDDWSVGEYNAYMAEMYQTILAWDKIGWSKGCWNDAGRRARWVVFMNAFGKHYGAYGRISSASFVSDSEEKPAREFARQLATWGDELNAACATNIPHSIPNPGPKREDAPLDYLKWGVYLVGVFFALQVIGSLKSATRY